MQKRLMLMIQSCVLVKILEIQDKKNTSVAGLPDVVLEHILQNGVSPLHHGFDVDGLYFLEHGVRHGLSAVHRPQPGMEELGVLTEHLVVTVVGEGVDQLGQLIYLPAFLRSEPRKAQRSINRIFDGFHGWLMLRIPCSVTHAQLFVTSFQQSGLAFLLCQDPGCSHPRAQTPLETTFLARLTGLGVNETLRCVCVTLDSSVALKDCVLL